MLSLSLENEYLNKILEKMNEENPTKDLKFHTAKAIGMATFIGGPAAAGYLIRENYLSLNEPEQGKKALIIGIVTTIIIFVLIFSIPEHIIDKIPNFIIPAVYTGVVYLIIEKIHGSILKKHQELNNAFYSGWKAAGIGLISLIIIGIGIFGYAYLEISGPEYDAYNTQLEKFYDNETETLTFYDDLGIKKDEELERDLITVIIPKWEENIAIIKKSNTIENLPSDLIEYNKVLMKYSELRLEGFQLFKNTIGEDFANYEDELDRVHIEIGAQLDILDGL